jgi:predicted metal-dependent hydrolase
VREGAGERAAVRDVDDAVALAPDHERRQTLGWAAERLVKRR